MQLNTKFEYHREMTERGLVLRSSFGEHEVATTKEANGDYTDYLCSAYRLRKHFVLKYAWAIPNKAAINYISHLSPIIELGAGTGYWAYLLQKAGAEVVAFDKAPPQSGIKNHYGHNHKWTKVRRGRIRHVGQYPKHTLFLCWPPYDDDMAYKAARRTEADHIVFVGEGEYGCTANQKFFDYMHENFEVKHKINIPVWSGMHDSVRIYKRKQSSVIKMAAKKFFANA